MTFLTRHLNDANETYLQHLGHALRFSANLALASVACLAHALLPFLFVKTGSAIISRMHHDMVTHRHEQTPNNRAAARA